MYCRMVSVDCMKASPKLPFSWSKVWKKVHLQLNAFCHSFGVTIPKNAIFGHFLPRIQGYDFKIVLFGIGTPKLWQKALSWRWTFFQTWDQLKGSVLCNRNFRNMHWIPVGASLFASNIGSEHFIGINNHTNQSALTQPTSLSRLGWFRSCIWSRDRLLWNERHLHPHGPRMVSFHFVCLAFYWICF